MNRHRTVTLPDGRHVVISNHCATLWKPSENFPGQAEMVWLDEEPNLYSILRRAAFIRKDDGTPCGSTLYLTKQCPDSDEVIRQAVELLNSGDVDGGSELLSKLT